MPILRGHVFGTPNDSVLLGLFVFAPVAQQVLIAATHQSKAALHQPRVNVAGWHYTLKSPSHTI
jgi:hypothetical protein